MSSHLYVVTHCHFTLSYGQEPCVHHFLFLRWLEGKTKVILDGLQDGERVLVHDKLIKGPFPVLPETGKEGS